jgi:sigma-B regulation protein RsbU (phosphoserine phosphatase)
MLVALVARATGAPLDGAIVERPIDVLVVDDEETALRAAMATLRALGYPCRTARDAEEALHELAREPAAIVLSDWAMPGMNGLELCRALKQREPMSYVILATAHDDHAHLLEGVRDGVDDFLRKPLDLQELEARLLAASRLIRAVQSVEALRDSLRKAAS